MALSGNKLSGSIPDALAALASVNNLQLFGNKLHGGLPGALAFLAMLRHLDARVNRSVTQVQRRRNDNINKICFLEGVGEGKFYGKLSQNAVFLLENSMTIKFGNVVNLIVRHFVVIWEAPTSIILHASTWSMISVVCLAEILE